MEAAGARDGARAGMGCDRRPLAAYGFADRNHGEHHRERCRAARSWSDCPAIGGCRHCRTACRSPQVHCPAAIRRYSTGPTRWRLRSEPFRTDCWRKLLTRDLRPGTSAACSGNATASLPNWAARGSSRICAQRAAQRVAAVIARTLADPRGRWLFDPDHADARSEWALAGEDEGRIVHIALDRSFVAGGYRYIVDFKTGAHLGGDPTTFLRQEFDRYRPQLTRYARIVRALDPRPLRVALYHPLVEGGGRSTRWVRLDGCAKIVEIFPKSDTVTEIGAQLTIGRLR